MRKTPVICSLLMAFGLSAIMVGCEPASKGTKPKGKAAGVGSTTGGGAEVPSSPSSGKAETPKSDPPQSAEPPKSDETPKD